jgi:hypothetical protein
MTLEHGCRNPRTERAARADTSTRRLYRTAVLGLAVLALGLGARDARADGDIVPAAPHLTLSLLSYDVSTGLLHGATDAGTVTVQVLPGTRPGRAPLRALSSPIAAVGRLWNGAMVAYRPPTGRTIFGTVATSPFSNLLLGAVAAQGYVKINLDRDLASVLRIRPSAPPRHVMIGCGPATGVGCCAIHNAVGTFCIEGYGDATSLAARDTQCTAAGGVASDGLCSASPDPICAEAITFVAFVTCPLSVSGGALGTCVFGADAPAPYSCSSESVCTDDWLDADLDCGTAGGSWTRG